jgi:DNA-binding NarL/FixJ family response regulator
LSDNIEEKKTNLRKSKKQIEWQRNKVREMLTRGYAQYKIANTLHISQPTISRDIHYLQKKMHKTKENYGERLFEVLISFDGLD